MNVVFYMFVVWAMDAVICQVNAQDSFKLILLCQALVK